MRTPRATAPMRRAGYTLWEMALVLTMIGVFAVGFSAFLLEGVKAWQIFTFRSDAGMQARIALDWMVREIRETDVDSLGAPIIATASATTYSFTHYLEGDTNETVTFSWGGTAGNPLQRNGQTLAPSVTSLVFAYYDENDAALASLPLSEANRAQVRRVVITMTLTHDVYAYVKKIRGEAILRAPYD